MFVRIIAGQGSRLLPGEIVTWRSPRAPCITHAGFWGIMADEHRLLDGIDLVHHEPQASEDDKIGGRHHIGVQ